MTVPNGFVPTPAALADHAAAVAFGAERPSEVDSGGRLLLPGLGSGNLYGGVSRYCTEGESWNHPDWDYPMPECVAVERDPDRIGEFLDRHPDADVDVREGDFLLDPPQGPFDWVLANPPYTRYKEIDTDRREAYADRFELAQGQFPLHLPFFEQAYRLLKPGGWLTFILPASTLTANVAGPFRWTLRSHFVEPIDFLPPATFPVKVETMLLSVQKQRFEGPPSNLWLTMLRGSTAREILERVDHVDDVDAAIEGHLKEHQRRRKVVMNRDRRERRKAEQSDAERPTGLGGQGSLRNYGVVTA